MRIAQGYLHAIDSRDGRAMLVGEVNDVAVTIDRATGMTSFDYPSGTMAREITLDISALSFSVLLAPSKRLLTLRRQAMRKGRPGWRSIR